MSRRGLLKAAGGLVVGIVLSPLPSRGQDGAPSARLPGSLNTNRQLAAWLRVGPDGTVTVFTGKAELGQGIASALAQIAADELDVDGRRVSVVTADTARTPDEGFTAGSQSIEQSGSALRFACAEARQILIATAASRLGVVPGTCSVADGTVTTSGGRGITYWEVATEAMLQREAGGQAAPKPPRDFTLIGRSLPRRDLPSKFSGVPAFIHDLRLPGLVHARVGRPPAPRAELVSLDVAALKAMPGVIEVVRDGSFLAVVCEREEQAISARLALRERAVWTSPERPAPVATLPDPPDPHWHTQDSVVHERVTPGSQAGVRQVEATYTRAFQMHASIGPSCAVALSAAGRLTVWTHSQGVFALRGDMARAFDLAPGDITCVHMEGAGCYGHNGADDAAFDAALVARALPGRPVRVQWMRDDEFQWEPLGPAMRVHVRARLGADGTIADWRHELWSYPHSRRPGAREGVNLLAAADRARPAQTMSPVDIPQPNGGSDRNAIPLYDFPNQSVLKHFLPDAPVRTSSLRGLGAYANVFAIESTIDAAAALVDGDPVAYRLRHLRDERARTVIAVAARMSDWRADDRGDGGRGSGRMMLGRGIGFAQYKNHACYCAVVAEVEVDRVGGGIRVTRAWSAVDAGLVINPDGIANQIEGGLIQSVSWTLKEGARVDGTRVLVNGWLDYPILRFSEVPKVVVELIQAPGQDSLGVGEGAQGPTAAAIANAFAAATGTRLRNIPFTPARVRAALGHRNPRSRIQP